MFGPITLPFGAKMLFNTLKLKPDVTFEDVEVAVGEMSVSSRKPMAAKKEDSSLARYSSSPVLSQPKGR